jgi:hypothetical protein
MVHPKDIHTLTEFKRNSTELLEQRSQPASKTWLQR